MKFDLATTGNFYPDSKERKALESLGFKIDDEGETKGRLRWYKDASVIPVITINTLEELVTFHEKWGSLILREAYDDADNSNLVLEIYDDYRE